MSGAKVALFASLLFASLAIGARLNVRTPISRTLLTRRQDDPTCGTLCDAFFSTADACPDDACFCAGTTASQAESCFNCFLAADPSLQQNVTALATLYGESCNVPISLSTAISSPSSTRVGGGSSTVTSRGAGTTAQPTFTQSTVSDFPSETESESTPEPTSEEETPSVTPRPNPATSRTAAATPSTSTTGGGGGGSGSPLANPNAAARSNGQMTAAAVAILAGAVGVVLF